MAPCKQQTVVLLTPLSSRVPPPAERPNRALRSQPPRTAQRCRAERGSSSRSARCPARSFRESVYNLLLQTENCFEPEACRHPAVTGPVPLRDARVHSGAADGAVLPKPAEPGRESPSCVRDTTGPDEGWGARRDGGAPGPTGGALPCGEAAPGPAEGLSGSGRPREAG